jgi:hypothetical protein
LKPIADVTMPFKSVDPVRQPTTEFTASSPFHVGRNVHLLPRRAAPPN